ncbi:MAG TPA: ATP-binding cassette domain-containing protein [Actinomycetota bacterium]
MPTDRPPIVALEDVVVRFDGHAVLGPVSLTIREGERWVLLGPNGSGKTTLLTVIGARRQPSSGAAHVLGLTFGRGDVRTLHEDIGHTSHALAELFPPGLRVIEVVLTGKRAALSPWFQIYDDEDRGRAEERLDAVGCVPIMHRVFDTCSQGERQRVLLARAMFWRPKLLVLDEPSAGLDLPARETLIDAIERSIGEDPLLTLVMATHHLEEIPPSATHAALLRGGRCVVAGPIEGVLTTENLHECFGLDIELSRRHGRWQAIARSVPATSPDPAPAR